MKQFNNNKAFTLTELLVVTGIILVLSAIILPNYRVGERSFALQRSAHKLAQDLRGTEEMAMSAKKFNCPTGILNGYMVYAWINWTDYYRFALCDSSSVLDKIIPFEKGVKIKEIAFYRNGTWELNKVYFWVSFKPPDPTIEMIANSEKIKITLSLIKDQTKTKTVIVEKSGLIYVE